MIAPIDATATVEAGDDRIVLTLNMRTLALAKKAGVNLMALDNMGDLDALDLALVVEAYATPKQPEFDSEQAFALLVRYSTATKTALEKLTSEFAAAAGMSSAEDGDAGDPPVVKPRTKRQT